MDGWTAMIGEHRQLLTDAPVEFEKQPVEVSPVMPTLLKKGENLDAAKEMRILRGFNNYSKDCWPMARHFTFNVDYFKYEKSPNKWIKAAGKVRSFWRN